MLITSCTPASDKEPDKDKRSKSWTKICKDWDDWGKPAPPFKLYGNSYYVGTCGNIKTLGFSISDVKILLHSHEHFDHVAGLAKLQKLSGAKLLASAEAAPVLRTGITAAVDPQAGMHESFPPARVDAIVNGGEAVTLGDLKLIPIATPGHTVGALSWQWYSCVERRCLSLVFADSLTPISRDNYYFSDHPKYVEKYQQGIEKLAALDCQLIVSSHPSASKMRDRLLLPEGLIDSSGCKDYASKTLRRLDKRLLKERQ